MGFIKELKKFEVVFFKSKEKEVSKMKKLIIVCSVALLVVGLNVMPAMAYTPIGTAVSISASGSAAGSSITFSATVLDASTGAVGTPAGAISFGTTSSTDLTNSGRVIKISGGTNEVDARIIIYTDNASNSTSPNKVTAIDPNTGVDGAGLVGRTNAGYSVPLVWGIKSGSALDPNSNVAYTTDVAVYGATTPAVTLFSKANLLAGLHCVYVVDKRHTQSFLPATVPLNWVPGTLTTLDAATLYKADGTAITPSTAQQTDGLYPQLWSEDLYDTNVVATRKVISEALYKNIATVAFSIAPGGTTDSENYVCVVPKLTTPSGADNVKARLGLIGTAGTPGYIFVYIAGDFAGVPAQVYGTDKLTVEMVRA